MPWQAWLLGAAVAVWIAGFDVLYALFDLDVDRAQGLQSLPARFGVRATFVASRLLPRRDRRVPRRGRARPAGRGAVLARGRVRRVLLAYEQSLVSPRDWRRLDTAFFTMNGVISLAFFAFVLADVLRDGIP